MREIADNSKISLRYLEALEQDRFDVLPAPVFARGFLREYARVVGLNPDEVVNLYLVALEERAEGSRRVERPKPARSESSSSAPSSLGYGLLLGLAVVLFVGIAALLSFLAERRRAAPLDSRLVAPATRWRRQVPPGCAMPPDGASRRSPPAARAGRGARRRALAGGPGRADGAVGADGAGGLRSLRSLAAAAAAAAGPFRVVLNFSQDCWMESVVDGNRRTSELKAAGETVQLEAFQFVVLTLGNSRAVTVEVEGVPFALPENSTRVVRDLRIERPGRTRAAAPGTPAGPRLPPAHLLQHSAGPSLTPVASTHPLVEQVRSGQSRELQLLAAQGILPLSAQDLIPAPGRARGLREPRDLGLRQSPRSRSWIPSSLRRSLRPRLPRRSSSTFAANPSHPFVLEALLRRRDIPRHLLVDLADKLGPDLQESLLLRQDAIIEEPEILVALEANPELSVYSRRKIAEYREHLLPRARSVEEQLPSNLLPDVALDAEDLVAIERARELPAVGERDEKTGLSESQIRALPVPLKIKLTRGASRTLRNILIKDTNQSVALSVIVNAAMSDDEIAQIASSRSVIDEVLTLISRRREWLAKYKICPSLAKNPRIPVGVAVKLLPKLSVRDLRSMSKDRNVSDAVRSAAGRLYRIKTK